MQELKGNKILDFFGVQRPLFVQGVLQDEDLQRFVDRVSLLKYFEATIDIGQNCAIIGEQGSGKSSFLVKLRHLLNDSIFGDYLQFSFPLEESDKSRLHFLRVILRSILNIIVRNDRLFSRFTPEDITFEIERLEYSIIVEDYSKTQKAVDGTLEAGIKDNLWKVLIPAEFKAKLSTKREKETGKSEKKEYPIHNENTLFNSILKLLEKIDEPVVLFIDELDKVGRYPLESPEWDKEVMKILELSREIMLASKLILVFALQNQLYEKLRMAEMNKGDVSILGLINAFKKLEGFDLQFAGEAVAANLKYAGYKGSVEDLFQHGVIEIALAETDGNPRLFMHYLIELTKYAYLDQQQKISLELLKKYFLEIGKITEKEWNSLLKKIPAPIKNSDPKELL